MRPGIHHLTLLLGLSIAAAAGGCSVPAAAGPADTYGLDFSLPQDARKRGAIIFLVDGLNADVFEEMLQAGELPAIKRYFLDRGLYAPHAVANTPSVTMANLTSLVTGQFPGHHGVTGINWFDRNRLVWRDYETIAQKNTLDGDYTAPTIYELLPDELTFSVFFQPHRGATKFVENWTSAGPPFFFGWYEFVDRLTLYRLGLVADIARECRRFPAVTICYMLATDFRAYERGVSSAEYREAIRHTAYQLGRVLGDLERAGLLDKVRIALISDHGMLDVDRHFDPAKLLSDRAGIEVCSNRVWEDRPFEQRLKTYGNQVAVPYGSGDRYWALCLRKPIRGEGGAPAFEPWAVRPSADDLRGYPGAGGNVDLVKLLCEQDAVDAVAYSAGADRVRVARRGGEVEFRQSGGRGRPISYRVISGADPLGWADELPADALAGGEMTPRQWLEATVRSDYPDLPAQILAYFRSRYAGDLAVFAASGWDFNNVNRAGHGGLSPGDMFVPLMLAGPGVPHARVDVARAVDLMPTLLGLLGRRVPADVDGQSLVP